MIASREEGNDSVRPNVLSCQRSDHSQSHLSKVDPKTDARSMSRVLLHAMLVAVVQIACVVGWTVSLGEWDVHDHPSYETVRVPALVC